MVFQVHVVIESAIYQIKIMGPSCPACPRPRPLQDAAPNIDADLDIPFLSVQAITYQVNLWPTRSSPLSARPSRPSPGSADPSSWPG